MVQCYKINLNIFHIFDKTIIMKAFNPLNGYKKIKLEEFNFNNRSISKTTFWLTSLCSAAIIGSILPWTDDGILGWNGENVGIRIAVLLIGILFLSVGWGLGQYQPDIYSIIEIDPDSKDSTLNLTITAKKENKDIATKVSLTLDNSNNEFYYVGNLIFLECQLDRLPLPTGVIDHYLDLSSKRNEEVLTICFEINSKEQTSPKELISILNKITTSTPF
jgi:hypothetical protein